MRIFEPEAKYIPYVDRGIVPKTSNSIYSTQIEDIKELRPLWDDKIIITYSEGGSTTRGNDYIVTYIGDTKPPDMAFGLKIEGWRPIPFGYTVKRIDYKKYNVHVFGTD